MDDIFTELNLETLAAVFQRETIVPSIVQSMINEIIERLDVTATGDRVRLRELCFILLRNFFNQKYSAISRDPFYGFKLSQI